MEEASPLHEALLGGDKSRLAVPVARPGGQLERVVEKEVAATQRLSDVVQSRARLCDPVELLVPFFRVQVPLVFFACEVLNDADEKLGWEAQEGSARVDGVGRHGW